MKIIKLNPQNPNPSEIIQIAKTIESGGLVVHPTDTTYGLAANVFNEDSIRKIFKLKGRDFNKPLIVAIKDLTQARTLVEFNRLAEVLFHKFFPGPLTLVLPRKPLVPSIVTGGKPLGIRMPNCKITLALSNACSVPYTTTSANPSGKPAPYKIEELIKQFGTSIEEIDLIIDAGALPEVFPSTVVDLTNETPQILRSGPITEAQIFQALNSKN